MLYENKKKPDISPGHAKFIDHVTSVNATKQGCDEHEGEKYEHNANEKRKGIHAVEKMKWLQNMSHQMVFNYETGGVSRSVQLQGVAEFS